MDKNGNKRNIPVARLHEKFIDLCWAWIAANRSDKNGLGKRVKLPHSRISELIGKKHKRTLSMYYIGLFIKKGVFTVADIYDGKPESDAEREEWEYLMQLEDREIQEAVFKSMKDHGGNLTKENLIAFLKTHHSTTSK